MKNCPFCAEQIQEDAIKCRHCGEWLNKNNITGKVINSVKSTVKNDIKKAYYCNPNSPSLSPGKSISCWLFIGSGMVAGFFLPAFILDGLRIHSRDLDFKVIIGISFLVAFVGGFLGQVVHKKINDKI